MLPIFTVTVPPSSASGRASDELHARHHVVELVDIDLDRLARGQRRAGFQPAGIGAAGEIAEQREAELRACRRGARARAEAAETDLVAHDVSLPD